MNNIKKTVIGSVLGIVTAVSAFFSFYYVEGGEFVREQSPNGSSEWVLTQGIHWKVPFLSRIDKFNQFITIDMTSKEEETSSVDREPLQIKFSDTYTGKISTSWRFALSPNPVTLEKMYQATKSQENLNYNTLLRYAQNILIYTGNQFLGEDYMQGGQNEFLSRLYFQSQHGLYQTKRIKKLITNESSFVSPEDQASGKSDNTAENFVWVVEIQRDAKGNPITANKDNILADFGIEAATISIVAFDEDADLKNFMNEKKQRIRVRSGIVEDQRNEREQAITAKLTGERERIQARSEKLKLKDAAVIAEELKVEVAKKQAELATVNKQKELEIAKSNKAIQEANFESAKFEAQAIKEKGLAEAEVSKAKYQALNNPVYIRELEKDQAVKLYEALPNIDVEMPYIIQGSGTSQNGLSDNVGTWSSLGILNQMGVQIPKK